MLHQLRCILQSSNLCKDALSKKTIQKLKIVIDFSSPNIAKTFHMGNLRGTLLGNFIQKIYRCAGHEVVSINYLGDWGKQFAILGTYWNIIKERPTEKQWQDMSSKQKVEFLTKCYVNANTLIKSNPKLLEKVHALFGQMETSLLQNPHSAIYEEPAMRLWQEWRLFSTDYLNSFYRQFGIEFSEWDCESGHVREAQELVEELLKRKIASLTPEQLCVVSDKEVNQLVVIRKSDKSTLYLTRDLAAIHSRHRKFNADQYIYVVDSAQKNHFIQLKEILNLMKEKDLSEKIKHVSYGRVVGLSTRDGRNDSVDFITERGEYEARRYLEESPTIKLLPEELSDVSQKVSRSIIIHESIRRRKYANYSFHFHSSFSEHSALFFQMKYSRLNSMELANVDVMDIVNARAKDGNFGKLSLESTAIAMDLAKLLNEFDGAVVSAYEENEPSHIAIFLMKLALQCGKSSMRLRVKGEPVATAVPRMMLFAAAKKVLGEGMQILGIEPLKRL